MREKADVRSLQALEDARAALADFRDVVRTAIGEAVSDAQRIQFRLCHDGRLHWRAQLRHRQEKLQQARSELARAELAAQGSMVSVREEKALVERWIRAVDEAEQKLRNIKRWDAILEREITLFKGQLQPLARAADADLPKAAARLQQMAAALEEYVRLPSTGTPAPRPAAETSPESPTEESTE